MPQSLARILVHLVFSTKNRLPLLALDIQAEVHAYLSVVLRENDCLSLQIGGTEDHVHILFGLSRTLTVAQVVERVKTSSSKWLKTKGGLLSDFHWQAGYGAFSVSQSDVDLVIQYIRGQAEHHRSLPFQAEYRWLLDRYQVPYDERYLWE